ncbi:MAG: ABC transporter ATP-binding protein [Firmicutes bacterium]|nr:ABC transporter ATP-binding protein [Bacillota bacterium]
MSLARLRGVSREFGQGPGKIRALTDVTLAIDRGDLLAVVGKSGSGKSTLLNVLGGLDSPTAGEYWFDDDQISGLTQNKLADFRCQNIGIIVQHFALIDDMSVFDNVALPLRYMKLPGAKIKGKVQQLLAEMEIPEKIHAYPYQLSRGQCQRVAIARALACNPLLLLADEPTGSVDEKTGQTIIEIFRRLNQQGVTIVIATHDAGIASICKRTLRLADGRVLQADKCENSTKH